MIKNNINSIPEKKNKITQVGDVQDIKNLRERSELLLKELSDVTTSIPQRKKINEND